MLTGEAPSDAAKRFDERAGETKFIEMARELGTVGTQLLADTTPIGGWMAHALEQQQDNRLVRPVSEYGGDVGRS